MSLACICMGVSATLDNSALPPHPLILSMTLIGFMLIPSIIARAFNWWKGN